MKQENKIANSPEDVEWLEAQKGWEPLTEEERKVLDDGVKTVTCIKDGKVCKEKLVENVTHSNNHEATASMELLEAISSYLTYGLKLDMDGIRGGFFGLFVEHHYRHTDVVQEVNASIDFFCNNDYIDIKCFKPILRSMERMTEDERKEYEALISNPCTPAVCHAVIKWLNCHFFDYRGLIARGAAIEARKNEYGYE